ncbi:DNA-binding protein [Stenotrophomonas pavanii]|uniref:DNA-binding protein n=1 Tax=Stenotrophomonas pavanii TaxID=487698 RepID=UPI002893DA8B|nr:DNA-binding protein [Stenotrophomonas pavanii]MDT3529301.1 DNA-binding protein [Stenotrophomonas pavanii]
MARGLTELDVHHAADDLVAGGERPTVERIRAHLGTGSPNTVTRHLETWWSSVGARLRQRAREDSQPEVPAPVLALAQRCWTAALEGAGEHARAALHAERAALEEERARLVAERATREQEQQDLRVALAEATAAQTSIDLLRAQLTEAAAQAQELRAQRDGAHARQERLEQQLVALHHEMDQLHLAHQGERQEWAEHARSTEDRLNVEVDRLRVEACQLTQQVLAQTQVAQQLREREQAQQHERRQEQHEAAAALTAQTLRAEQLAAQLAPLRELVATLRQAAGGPKTTRRGRQPKEAGAVAATARPVRRARPRP